jgi:hypothetical protein
MYKQRLFAHGAKRLLKSKSSLKSYRHKSSKTGSGLSSNIDDYLLSLVKGVQRMSIKPAKKPAKSRANYGGALRFIR